MPAINTRDNSRAVVAILAVAAMHVLGAAGCSRTRYYTARTIPAELLAPPVANAQTVDLSRFSGPPVTSDLIDRGDLLRVSLAAGLGAGEVTTFFVRVGDDGIALLPDIGQVQLAGLRLAQAEQQIAAACMGRDLYRQPHVTVSMERQQVNSITVVGGVKQPGIHKLPRGSSYLLTAIVAAGGLAEDAGTRVELRRPHIPGRIAWQQTTGGVSCVDPRRGAAGCPSGVQPAGHTVAAPGRAPSLVYLDLAETAIHDRGGEYLEDGSVVTLERRMPDPIQVVGLVRRPGQYEFPVNHELRLFGAIAQAGGLSSTLADKVLVIRRTPNAREGAIITLSVSAAKRNPEENLRLAPGDIVSVEQTPATVALDIVTRVLRFAIGGNIAVF